MGFFDIRCDILELIRENYKMWKERILLHLGWMDIDYAIRHEKSLAVDDDSEPYEINLYERWERSNRLNIMFIKTKLSAAIRSLMDHYTRVKDLLKAIDEQFKTSEKALVSTLIMKFSTLRLTGTKGVRDHIIQIGDIVAQLKTLEIEMSETFLVHYILNTLPPA